MKFTKTPIRAVTHDFRDDVVAPGRVRPTVAKFQRKKRARKNPRPKGRGLADSIYSTLAGTVATAPKGKASGDGDVGSGPLARDVDAHLLGDVHGFLDEGLHDR